MDFLEFFVVYFMNVRIQNVFFLQNFMFDNFKISLGIFEQLNDYFVCSLNFYFDYSFLCYLMNDLYVIFIFEDEIISVNSLFLFYLFLLQIWGGDYYK